MLVSRFAVSAIATEASLIALLEDLDLSQQVRFAALKNPQRRAQFLSARHLAQQLLQLNQRAPRLIQQDSARPSAADWPFIAGLSWSHGAQYCAAALGQGRVGVDLETIRPRKQLQSIAESYFDPRETAWLASLPAAAQLRGFYILWVAKEALLKALGTGIVGGLQRFVLLHGATGWRCESPDECAWSLQIWEVAPDVLLALACDVAQPWQVMGSTTAWQMVLAI